MVRQRGVAPVRHGGNKRLLALRAGVEPRALLDFSANINPLGFPPWLREVISRNFDFLTDYPDPDCTALVQAISRCHGVSPESVVVGNGSEEIIACLPRALAPRRVVAPVPAFAEYRRAAEQAGVPVWTLPMKEESGFRLDTDTLAACLRPGDLVFLGQPNNPTGGLVDPSRLERLVAAHPEARFAVDEAFMDFTGLEGSVAQRSPNLVVIRSFTKTHAVPGLRIGFAVGAPLLMGFLRQALPTWSVNTLAQHVGVAALEDAGWLEQTVRYVEEQRNRLVDALSRNPGLHVFPSRANFLLLRLQGGRAAEVAQALLREGIAVRECADFEGLDERFLRVAVRSGEDNERLVAALETLLADRLLADRRLKREAGWV